jgi:hypothetical protein
MNALGRHAGPMKSKKRVQNKVREELQENLVDFREFLNNGDEYCMFCDAKLADCNCDWGRDNVEYREF